MSERRNGAEGGNDVDALVRQLHDIEQKLAGIEVDAVLGPTGQRYLLREAQETLLLSEVDQRRSATLQSAVLDALPANVALLDEEGGILSVNGAWRQFAAANGQTRADSCVGVNYVHVCEAVVGEEADDALAAAAGTRAVLRGEMPAFEFEYACHSPEKQRWFRLTVTPVSGLATRRAVVMHVDISRRRLAELKERRNVEQMAALVGAQRELAAHGATLDELLQRVPDLALAIVDADAAMFDRVEDDTMVCRTGSALASDAIGLRIPLDQGFSGEAVRRNGTVVCDDTQTDPCVASEACEAFGVRSVLAVVVRDRDGPVGVLKLVAFAPGRFGTEEAARLELLGEAIGALIQRRHAEQEVQQSLRVQAGIVCLQQQVSASGGDLQASLELVVGRARELIGVEGAALFLADGDAMVCRAASGSAIDRRGDRLSHEGSLAGLVVATEQLLRCDDSEVDPRVDRAACGRSGMRSALIAPLRGQGGVVGVLKVASARAFAFGDHDAGSLQILAEWLGALLQRAAAAEALQLSERQYRLVFSANPFPMWIYDTETLRFLAVNDATVRRYGYSSDEFLSMTTRDIRPASEMQRFNEHVAQRHADVQFSDPWIHRAKDGTQFEVEASSNSIRFGGRDARLVLCSDVSERRRDQRQLQRSEAVLAIAGRVARVAGWSFQLAGRVFEYSDELCVMHDLPRGSRVTVERILDFCLPECRPAMVEAAKRCAQDGTAYDLELGCLTAAGRRIVVRTIGYAVRDSAGAITGTQGAVQDVTERRAEQEALRSLNENLEAKVLERTSQLESTHSALASKEEEIRSVVEHMADAVISFGDDGIVRAANPMVEAIFGFAPDEVTGRSVAALVPDLLLLLGGEAIAGARREARGVHRNGDGIALEMSISDYSLRGERYRTAILRDITDRLATMADLEQARYDAEQASRAKSSFVATMSHEIRTPMNGVIGMMDVLEQTVLTPEQARMLDLARESAHSLMGVIEDILDFSKIEAGKIAIERRPISIPQVVQTTCAIVQGIADSQQVALTHRLDAHLPDHVWGDALRVRQILLNLLSNAIKFSGGSERAGRVALRLHARRSAPGQGVLDIVVEDNGIGMNEAAVQSLFKPFVQADATTTRRFGGTGLGLTISKHLAELMGGDILVASTPGVGSTFTFRLPFETATGAAAAESRGAGSSPVGRGDGAQSRVERSELILVAEDNLINQQVIAAQLKRLGFSAVIVGNGIEALARWRSGGIAIVITDLQMPEMDGYGLAASIRLAEGVGRRTPIIALTANAMKEESDRCRAAGMDGYLTKPASLNDLGTEIDRWLHDQDAAVTVPPVVPPVSTQAPIDVSVLPGFVGDDPVVLHQFFVDFRRSLIETEKSLLAAVEEGRASTVGAIAHRLKSSAKAVGAMRFADLLETAESAVDEQRTDLRDIGSALQFELRRVVEWIASNHPECSEHIADHGRR